jgi:hypothetical protein
MINVTQEYFLYVNMQLNCKQQWKIKIKKNVERKGLIISGRLHTKL